MRGQRLKFKFSNYETRRSLITGGRQLQIILYFRKSWADNGWGLPVARVPALELDDLAGDLHCRHGADALDPVSCLGVALVAELHVVGDADAGFFQAVLAGSDHHLVFDLGAVRGPGDEDDLFPGGGDAVVAAAAQVDVVDAVAALVLGEVTAEGLEGLWVGFARVFVHGVFIGNDGLAVVGETEDAALLLAGFDFVVSIDARGVDGDA